MVIPVIRRLSRILEPVLSRQWPWLLNAGHVGDGHVHQGHVGQATGSAGLNGGDAVNHAQACYDATKHGVAGVLCIDIVQAGVVFEVDVELAGGAVWVGGAGHGQGTSEVAEAVLAFKGNGGRCGYFWAGPSGEATRLNNKVGDDAVKQGVLVKTVGHIAQKVVGRNGGFGLVEFHHKTTEAGGDQNLWVGDGEVLRCNHFACGVDASEHQCACGIDGAGVGQVAGHVAGGALKRAAVGG